MQHLTHSSGRRRLRRRHQLREGVPLGQETAAEAVRPLAPHPSRPAAGQHRLTSFTSRSRRVQLLQAVDVPRQLKTHVVPYDDGAPAGRRACCLLRAAPRSEPAADPSPLRITRFLICLPDANDALLRSSPTPSRACCQRTDSAACVSPGLRSSRARPTRTGQTSSSDTTFRQRESGRVRARFQPGQRTARPGSLSASGTSRSSRGAGVTIYSKEPLRRLLEV